MKQDPDRLKAEILDRIRQGVPAEAAAFARRFYEGLSVADLTALGADELIAGCLRMWELLQVRPATRPALRLFQPGAGDGWSGRHVIAEIVNDDMPFLVDSVTAELTRHGLEVDLVIHPVIAVARDVAGRLERLGEGKPESVMQVRATGIKQPEELARIGQDLGRVLADVRAAVTDWRAMLDRLGRAAAEVATLTPGKVSADEIYETKDFLDWLSGNHFTLLGYREYRYDGDGEHRTVEVVEGSGLGILRDPRISIFGWARETLPPNVRSFLERPVLLLVAKAARRATVHRAVFMDVIGVKRLDDEGRVVCERRFIGLFTSRAYSRNPREIPLLRRKIASVLERADFPANSHDGKALAHILETYPRDELFQIPVDALYDTALGILQLQERRRIALFVRRDPLERTVSCLVYVPQERYDAALRDRFQAILAEAFGGEIVGSYIQLADSPLARLHLIIAIEPGRPRDPDIDALEARLVEAGRSWGDRLSEAMRSRHGEVGPARALPYLDAFPGGYAERYSPEIAVEDIALAEAATAALPALHLYRRAGQGPAELAFKILRPGRPVHLSDVLPMLENRGLRVLTEVPFALRARGAAEPVWLHDFDLATMDGSAVDVDTVRERFQDGLLASWTGVAEEDGFNRLTLVSPLAWREVAVLRAYAKYLRQTGFTYSQAYLEQTLAKHAAIAARIFALFAARLDPAAAGTGTADAIAAEIEVALEAVGVLDEDRILRRYMNLIRSTLRTNFYQPGADGNPKPYISFKLDSGAVDELPKPRPLREIWVYAPSVEAIHLRGGLVARGGIRWSDRREDFRTEILGLMKAQQVKNAVIVPVGSKGGFVVKRPPPAEAGRAALQAEVVASYKTMMRGLLDVTDNRKGQEIVHPPAVVRHDADDPYLVVAADKGTATFSDIANAVSQEYGFWLDDAFASGGSAGYDHKGLAITAEGAWVAVERHFRELGTDLARETVTVVGIGDMGGDVFGNGLLHSDRLRLVGAFNHLHVFVDPDPDPAVSFKERKRLFTTPGTSWADYDRALISPGGGVFERSAKSIKLSAEVQAAFGLAQEQATPAELIQAMLKAAVDLIWFGGIGTFIKASEESHAQVGDRANDALRVDARDIRAKVIGEGANLGVTQRGRLEYAAAGGRINTDAIDNSAGVDLSDHEVNIKILLTEPVREGQLDLQARNDLLASMAGEVAALVLRDNYLQTLAISIAQRNGAELVDGARALIRRLEQEAGLDRGLEALPTDAQLAARRSAGTGLYRPELAVLLAFSKIALYRDLVASPLPDDPALEADLKAYFPDVLQQRYGAAIERHGLRREIIATLLGNEIVNRGGMTFVSDLERSMGAKAPAIGKVYVVARELFELPELWHALEALDGRIDAAVQLDAFAAVAASLDIAVRWLLRQSDRGSIADHVGHYSAPLARLARELPPASMTLELPLDLAPRIASFGQIARNLDIIDLAVDGVAVEQAGKVYLQVGERLGINRMRALAAAVPTPDPWSRQAVGGLGDDLAGHQRRLAARLIGEPAGLDGWVESNRARVERLDRLVGDLQIGAPDLARLSVAERALRELAG